MHELIRLLTEFGADDDLIALATRFVTPDEGEALTDDDLTALDAGLVAFAENDEASAALLREAADTVVAVRSEVSTRDEAAVAEEAAIEAERARLRGDTPTDETPETGEGDGGETPAAEGDAAAEAEAPAEPEAEVVELEPVAASAKPAARRALRASTPKRAASRPEDSGPPKPRMRFLAGVPGRNPGEDIESLHDIDRALWDRHDAFRLSSAGSVRGVERIPVAQIKVEYPDERSLINEMGEPLSVGEAGRKVSGVIREGLDSRKARRGVRTLTAAAEPIASISDLGPLCAPPQPIWSVDVLGDDRRPVRDEAMVNFMAARGAVVSVSPPTIAALAGSVGAWTLADDATASESEDPDDPENPKDILDVDCGVPRYTAIEGIYRRLRFRNLQSRAFPEYDSAFVQLSLTWQARFAERRLLAAIKAGSINTALETTHMSATRDLLNLLNRSAENERIHHRLPDEYPFRVILPTQLEEIIREDIAKSFPGGSVMENLGLADAQIAQWFAVRNLNVTWSPDLIDVSEQTAGIQVYDWPTHVEVAMYPEGTWLHLDDGTIDLGIVRDTRTVRANTFQTFAETFEGAHKLGVFSLWHNIAVCPSGATAGTLDPAPDCAAYT